MEKGSTLEQFLKDLAGNTLGRIEHVAMVKPDDGKSGGLLVAVQPGCERWIPLPAAVIDRVEYLETARCKDHTHPLVRLTLRMPPEDNPIAVLFAELLFQQTKSAALSASSSADLSVLPSAQLAPSIGRPPDGGCQPGIEEPCQRWPDGVYREVFRRADCSSVVRLCGPSRPTSPSISVTPGAGAFYISGRGFTGGSTVYVIYNYFPITGRVTTNSGSPSVPQASSSGDFATIVYVSSLNQSGQLAVQATDGTGRSASAVVQFP